jgi:putative phage-type endonuclease
MLTKEQLIFRKQGIGSSEISSILGLCPWSGAFEVWADKTGLSEPKPPTEAMNRGIYLEPGIIEWTAQKENLLIKRNCETFQHKTDLLLMATPDGFIYKDDKLVAVLEVKSPGRNTYTHWKHPDEDPQGFPIYYLGQLYWEMGVCGVKWGILGAMLFGELWTYRIEFDAKIFKKMVKKAHEFWKFVEQKQPPPKIDYRSIETARQVYKHQKTTNIEITENQEVTALLSTFYKINEDCKILEQQRETAKAQIIAQIKGEMGIQAGNYLVTYKETKNPIKTDWKNLALSLKPSQTVIDQFSEVQEPVRRLQIKQLKLIAPPIESKMLTEGVKRVDGEI